MLIPRFFLLFPLSLCHFLCHSPLSLLTSSSFLSSISPTFSPLPPGSLSILSVSDSLSLCLSLYLSKDEEGPDSPGDIGRGFTELPVGMPKMWSGSSCAQGEEKHSRQREQHKWRVWGLKTDRNHLYLWWKSVTLACPLSHGFFNSHRTPIFFLGITLPLLSVHMVWERGGWELDSGLANQRTETPWLQWLIQWSALDPGRASESLT